MKHVSSTVYILSLCTVNFEEVTRGAVRVAGNPALRYSVQWADVLNSTQAVEESELEGEWREQSKTPPAPTTTTGPQLIEEVEGSGAPPEISTTPPLQPTSPCLGCDTKFCWGPVSPPTGNPTDCQTRMQSSILLLIRLIEFE